MKLHHGFTLIEILLLIIITGILGNTLLLSMNTATVSTPALLFSNIADQTAKECMEWFIGQRRLNGFTAISCPSTAVPSICTAPAGYSVAVNISCTSINGDNNYKTITVTVSGKGNSSFTSVVANY